VTDDLYGTPHGYIPNTGIQHDESGIYWTRERIALSARYQHEVYLHARRVADEIHASSITDIGCGTAVKLRELFAGRFAVFGVDTPEGVGVSRRSCPNGTFAAADLDSASLDLDALLPGCSKDVIICADVIEHLPHPERLLAAIRRFAAPHSRIVISSPDRDALVGPAATRPSVPEHVREWTTRELARFVERAGFVVLQQQLTYPFRFGIDRMTARFFASRLRHRLPLRTNAIVTCRAA
jgi:SAM-dependent methyltransferase